MPKRGISVGGVTHTLDVRPDRLDLRDRPYLPPAVSLPHQWPADKVVAKLFPSYVNAGLILDQGQEGACTGFGLAAVVNYLLWMRGLTSRGAAPKSKAFQSVSPYMLYDLARFYDEWPGQDYEGSSCRGAMKGWHKHGVCDQGFWTQSIYPSTLVATAEKPKKANAKGVQAKSFIPTTNWQVDAAKRPVGVYYRVDKNSVTDMQAAIYDVGAIYVSCAVHSGWSLPIQAAKARSAKPQALTHAKLPRIAFSSKDEPDGGHAFALVGFNEDGFVVQNSWGPGWGNNGFAVLAYDDWVQNGTDAWVCALGVPQSHSSRQAARGNLTRTASEVSLLSGDKPIKVKPSNPKAQPWSTSEALLHSIVAGNDGEVIISRPDHATPKISVAHAVDLFAKWAKDWVKKNPGQTPKLAIYAHGGLNSEGSGIERARVLGPYFQENGVYPLFYIWKTGFLEVLKQEAIDQLPIDPSQKFATGLLGEARDRLLEAAAHGPFRFMWRQMKQNAEAAKQSDRALGLLRESLKALSATRNFETHLVAHSAGSFVAGHLMALGQAPTSLSLFAPACSLDFALNHFKGKEPVGQTALHILTTDAEKNDFTGLKPPLAYGKSLLWLVSRGFEERRKTPLAGFAHCLDAKATDPDDDLWREEFYPQVTAWRQWVSALAKLPSGLPAVNEVASHLVTAPNHSTTASHGGFDNDVRVMEQTIQLIIGGKLAIPVEDLSY